MDDKDTGSVQPHTELQVLRQEVAALRDRLAAHTQRETDLLRRIDHLLLAHELSLDAFTIFRSVRDAADRIVDFTCEYANPAAALLLRRPVETMLGQRLLQMFPGNLSSSGLFMEYARVAETGVSLDRELYYQADGIDGWFHNKTIKIGDGVAVFFSNITARKRVEELERQRTDALQRESEARYQTLFENANDGIAVINFDRSIVMINSAMEKLLGRSREEVIGQDSYSMLTPSGRALAEKREQQIQAGEKIPSVFEHELLRKDGSTVWVEGRTRFIRDQAGTPIGFQGIYRDITERKRMDTALQVSEERFKAQYQELPMPTFTWQRVGEDFVLIDCNKAASRMTDGAIAQLMGKTARELYPDEPQVCEEMHRCWREHATLQREMGYRMRTTKKLIEFLITYVFAPPDLVMVYTEDIAERKRAEEERQRLQVHIHQAQKLEAIGILAGGIAHDFNNILVIMLGGVDLALDDVPSTSRAYENLSEVYSAGQRAKVLIEQLLTFSRPSLQERGVLQVQPLLEETLRFLRLSLPTTVRLHSTLTCPEETLVADATQLEQVVINLCLNGVQALPEQTGALTVHLERIEAEDLRKRPVAGLVPGPCLLLTVSDTGCGIAPEILPKVFDPFFSTKPVGQGTGLGLAVVHGVVTAHGGVVTVDSQLGQGTSVHVHLPITVAPSAGEPMRTALASSSPIEKEHPQWRAFY